MVMKESIASGAKLVKVRRLKCECFEGVLMDVILRSPFIPLKQRPGTLPTQLRG
jgi:hypothetical protein